ncbi:MAG: gamma-glutamyltransferase [Balneolaceae bacterium]|nr:gamma-glutamyltransferase [Balneolaceae bacterium]
MKPLCSFLMVLLSFGLLAPAVQAQPDRITGQNFATRSEVIGANGMVATSQPLATQVGLQVLRDGGNAIDAAIAANAALGLMEPTGSGIGGDLFAIVWSAEDRKLYGLNASGRSPMGMNYEDLQKELEERDRSSILPTGCCPSPSRAVDGWFSLHDRLGSMPMSLLLGLYPIRYAEEGFPGERTDRLLLGHRRANPQRPARCLQGGDDVYGRAPKKAKS